MPMAPSTASTSNQSPSTARGLLNTTPLIVIAVFPRWRPR
jgi:hypothetical protein